MNDALIIRTYHPDDLDGLTGLIMGQNRLAARKETPADIARSLERPGFDPTKDLLVAEKNGYLIGYLQLTPEVMIDTGFVQGWIDPSHRKKGIARQLLTKILGRTRELRIGSIRAALSQDNRNARRILPKLGFSYVRRYLELQMDAETIPAKAPDSTGISRSLLSLNEIPVLMDLLNRAFHNHWNYLPYDVKTLEFDLTTYDRSPEDVILFSIGHEVIGCCWTETDKAHEIAGTERHGVINMLGTDPEYRGRGYGRNFLLDGIACLREKKVRKILLSVDSENKTAGELYRSVGFTEYSSTLWYERKIGYDTQT